MGVGRELLMRSPGPSPHTTVIDARVRKDILPMVPDFATSHHRKISQAGKVVVSNTSTNLECTLPAGDEMRSH